MAVRTAKDEGFHHSPTPQVRDEAPLAAKKALVLNSGRSSPYHWRLCKRLVQETPAVEDGRAIQFEA